VTDRRDDLFAEHLLDPQGEGDVPAGAHEGAAGGAACGDLVVLRVSVQGDRVTGAGFDASGCGAIRAAASATVELVDGAPLLDAARVGPRDVAAALGGLSPGKFHAAELAADALHRALGAAAAADGAAAPHEGRTLVAMSGGVDSAVVALLTRADGDAVGVTVELWRDPANDAERSCCSASAVRRARALAHDLGMAHLTLDLRDEFAAGVVEPWLAGHAAGLTPNPCVRCNGAVRLDAMLDLATRLGAPALATGHYARIAADGLLRAAADEDKDQSYMLAALRPQTLARLRFPLGELTKPQVRAIAAEHELAVARTPDSQDLCFLAGVGKERFLATHGRLDERPGDILDRDGNAIGRHRGHHRYTVGQRRGIGIAAPEPQYVLATDARSNTVTIGPRRALETTRVALTAITLHGDPERITHIRLRYRSRALPGRLRDSTAILDRPIVGAAPGQAAVLLDADTVIGHATIA
jgi:tRNA-uridine 2-sulfurtransferase